LRASFVDIPSHMPSSDDLPVPHSSNVSEESTAAVHQLVVVGPEESGRTIDLVDGRHLLGRSPEADVRFSLETISRRHALFVVHGNHVMVEDLGSRVGTFVNGRRITSCSLPSGARLVIGGITMKLVKG
jgi:pSer/pThr/pTyr-binding forkhead associated (FHA) protein